MNNNKLHVYLALAAAVVLFFANFMPGLCLSASEHGTSASISCSVYGTSTIAGCLNWISAFVIFFVAFGKPEKFPILAQKGAQIIAFGAVAVAALLSFVLVITSNTFSVEAFGISLKVSLSGDVMDMIKHQLPKSASIGHGLGCWMELVGCLLAAGAALVGLNNANAAARTQA